MKYEPLVAIRDFLRKLCKALLDHPSDIPHPSLPSIGIPLKPVFGNTWRYEPRTALPVVEWRGL